MQQENVEQPTISNAIPPDRARTKQTIVPAPQPKAKRRGVLISVLLIVLAIAIGGYYIGTQKDSGVTPRQKTTRSRHTKVLDALSCGFNE